MEVDENEALLRGYFQTRQLCYQLQLVHRSLTKMSLYLGFVRCVRVSQTTIGRCIVQLLQMTEVMCIMRLIMFTWTDDDCCFRTQKPAVST